MDALRYGGVALISAPFVLMGLLMAFRGLRARAVTFAAAGVALVTLMGSSALLAVENISHDEVTALAQSSRITAADLGTSWNPGARQVSRN